MLSAKQFLKQGQLAGVALSVGAYVLLGYCLHRSQTAELLSAFGAASVGYVLLVRTPPANLLAWGMGLRLLFLVAEPTLSDDVYRFLWDGHLILEGIHPFNYLPAELMQAEPPFAQAAQLFPKLNSPNYFSIYPPLNQLFFVLAAAAGQKYVLWGVMALRLLILLAEFLTMKQLGSLFGANTRPLALYAFNPLIIIELSGNLHFEAWVICLLLLAYRQRHRWAVSAVALALAVLAKLTPLLLLPLWLAWQPKAARGRFLALFAAVLLLGFMPFLSLIFLQHLVQSIELYFQTFEFNASLYYLIRWLGFKLVGYNIIGWAGTALAGVATMLILLISLSGRGRAWGLPRQALAAWAVYLVFATTVHPWYVTPLILWALLAGRWWPLVWSVSVLASYMAYSTHPPQEHPAATLLSYGLVAVCWWVETRRKGVFINYSNKLAKNE